MKAGSVNRRQFLRGDLQGRRRPNRPPWAVAEPDFLGHCDRCGRCVEACAEGIIKVGSGGYPEMDFLRGECTFCEACAEACPTPALRLSRAGEAGAPWEAVLTIGDTCIAHQGVVCQVCGEQCEVRAIRFQRVVGGGVLPVTEAEACNGCGACVAPCPVGAVTVRVSPAGESIHSDERSLEP